MSKKPDKKLWELQREAIPQLLAFLLLMIGFFLSLTVNIIDNIAHDQGKTFYDYYGYAIIIISMLLIWLTWKKVKEFYVDPVDSHIQKNSRKK